MKADAAKMGGHGGMDFIMNYRVIECLRNGTPLDQNVYEGAFWSAVGPLSEASVAQDGASVAFPDFTRGNWKNTPPLPIIEYSLENPICFNQIVPRVLIVEDEVAIAENIIYALETEHFETTHVTTGKDALTEIKENPYNLIVLDIGLPDTTGLTVCQEIRTVSATPILFLTARDSELDRVLGLELGADDYVVKPFSPRELVARIKAILRRTETKVQTSSGTTQLDQSNNPIIHDSEAMTITCYGKLLDLTAHEYKLLATFISQPNRTFTREQLLEHAWDDPGSAMDRTVDAHIKTLRSKLNAVSDQCADFIQTRRGLGYCYQPPAS
eukprot:Seg16355.1 transcript_id=Seg16355.1/GoldUCD/mRNA.D3Y31 product="Transcriptional regulatory protein BaeR" protein_id=Seg16355.1/GoldUCD/D3Y31